MEWITPSSVVFLRIQKNPFLDLFDGPDGNVSLGEREASTTALQALYFMNSEFAHRQAEAIAARVLTEFDQEEDRVRWLYLAVFGQVPSEADLMRASEHLRVVEDSERAWAGYVRAMISSNAFLFVD